MKTAEEFVSKWSNWWITNNNKNVLDRAFENELKEIIEQAKNESYNQAIEDVLENVVIQSVPILDVSLEIVPKSFILKLKR